MNLQLALKNCNKIKQEEIFIGLLQYDSKTEVVLGPCCPRNAVSTLIRIYDLGVILHRVSEIRNFG